MAYSYVVQVETIETIETIGSRTTIFPFLMEGLRGLLYKTPTVTFSIYIGVKKITGYYFHTMCNLIMENENFFGITRG